MLVPYSTHWRSVSRLDTAIGQQRAGGDQPSRRAERPPRQANATGREQVSTRERTSAKIGRPATGEALAREHFFPFGSVIRGLSCIKDPLTACGDVASIKKMRREGSGGEGI